MSETIKPVVTLKLKKDETFWGPGVMMILQGLIETGSMKEVCAQTGVSYSKAWKILNRAEEQLGFALVDRQRGGKQGGGCLVTREGYALMNKYEVMEEKLQSYAATLFAEL